MPDLLCGYLSEDEMPNSLVLLSPPPELNYEAFILDLEHAKKAVESKIEFVLYRRLMMQICHFRLQLNPLNLL